MKEKPKLTVIGTVEFNNQVANTPEGMAHWAGTGPKGTTCRECSHYVFNGYTSSKVAQGGTLKNGPCQKYINLMNKGSKRIPHDTPSCKYFEANPKPPSITDQGKSNA